MMTDDDQPRLFKEDVDDFLASMPSDAPAGDDGFFMIKTCFHRLVMVSPGRMTNGCPPVSFAML